MRRSVPGLLALLLLAARIPPVDAGTEPVSEGLQRCAREADEHRRLACFDALTGSVPQIKSDQFGMTAAIAKQRDPSTPRPVIDPEVLGGKIAELRQGSHGEYIFTLDNGQVWIQQEPQPSVHFSVGEAVQIKHGAMSSLWLSAPHHRSTKVKRIS